MRECNPKAIRTAITENLRDLPKYSEVAVMDFQADAGHVVVTRGRMA